ncbi:MAG TPA: helix-turn-helix domain-containing protein [Chitinophagaceae bacterium]|nr:helix-turn-helix domain-containing protein [Chitinophagaceae bacterium]
MVLFLALFIAVFFCTSNKGRRVSNILLGSFFLAIALNLADTFLLLKQVYFSFPPLALWGSNMLLVCGPCIYLYTQSVIYKDFRFDNKKLRHFLLFIILFLVTEVSYLLAGREKQTEILTAIVERKVPPGVYIGSLVIYIHFFAYLFLSLRLVKRYAAAASNQYSQAQKITLQWLRALIVFFLALMLVSLVGGYLSFQSFTGAYFFVLGLTIFLLLSFIVFMLFKALRNPELFAVMEEKEIQEAAQPAKYLSSTLADDEKTRLLNRLQQYMQSWKPYLEPEITLNKLAAQIEVKPKTLSQVINELLQQNFFEFINFYRVEEAKRLLTNPKDKKITVLEVMYEVGFNSKSSFNTLFKKATGVTPSDFKRQNMG